MCALPQTWDIGAEHTNLRLNDMITSIVEMQGCSKCTLLSGELESEDRGVYQLEIVRGRLALDSGR